MATSCAAWIALASFVILSYASLPEVVAVDFDGMPEMGPKSDLLMPIAVILGSSGLIVALLNLFTLKRHALVAKYPYLINIPAFAMLMGRLDEARRREYVDRVFLILPAVAIGVLATMSVVAYFMLESARAGSMILPVPLFIATILVIPLAIIAGSILYYYRIYRELKEAAPLSG